MKRCIKKINLNKTNGQRTVTIPKEWPKDSEYVELFAVPINKEIKAKMRESKDD